MIAMKKFSEEEKKSSSDWMNTYGDMVTLLLTFFVMLYSFSTIDSAKMQQFLTSFQNNVGILYSGKSVISGENLNAVIGEAGEGNKIPEESPVYVDETKKDIITGLDFESIQKFQTLYAQIKQYITDNGLIEKVEIIGSNDEIKIRFLDNVLFQSGKADVNAQAESVLKQVAGMLQIYDSYINRIGVEGHTDSLPINTSVFESNWELSALRAVKVARYVIEKCNIPPQKVTAEGYGEYHPIGDNSTEAGRSKNRRVEIVITRAAVL